MCRVNASSELWLYGMLEISWELVEINEQRHAQEIGEINQLLVMQSS
jgi:hypothetical protein